ncbi:glycosyltransferase [Lacticaseibacillus jixiensis]|uniref:glycosyltransferase n=1 Tax=Lacticaseibacillus jixiensis TaxID=3231926 RepID=UPI0036F43FF3
MKLLFISKYQSGNGGTETVMTKTFAGLAQTNTITFVQGIASADQTWLQRIASCVKIMRGVRAGAPWLPLYTWRLAHSDADIVIAVDSFSIKLATHLRALLHKNYRVVSWIHFSLADAPSVHMHDLLKADAHIAISSGIQNEYQRLGVSANRIGLTYNPTDQTNQRVTLDQSPAFKLIYVGRIQLHGQKNLSYLFSSLAKAAAPIHLDVYGGGLELPAAKQLVHHLHIASQVTFHGWVSDVWAHIHCANALVLTSKFEGFPMALLEALKRGLPVICPHLASGADDLVDPGRNGQLYDASDPAALAALLDQPQLFTRLNQPQIIHSVAKFSYAAYIDRYNQALTRFAQLAPNPAPLVAKSSAYSV